MQRDGWRARASCSVGRQSAGATEQTRARREQVERMVVKLDGLGQLHAADGRLLGGACCCCWRWRASPAQAQSAGAWNKRGQQAKLARIRRGLRGLPAGAPEEARRTCATRRTMSGCGFRRATSMWTAGGCCGSRATRRRDQRVCARACRSIRATRRRRRSCRLRTSHGGRDRRQRPGRKQRGRSAQARADGADAAPERTCSARLPAMGSPVS